MHRYDGNLGNVVVKKFDVDTLFLCPSPSFQIPKVSLYFENGEGEVFSFVKRNEIIKDVVVERGWDVLGWLILCSRSNPKLISKCEYLVMTIFIEEEVDVVIFKIDPSKLREVLRKFNITY